MQAAINRGPHQSALVSDAINKLQSEVAEKVGCRQAWLVDWLDINDNPPQELKISPISMIPHTSCKYCTILNLSFSLWLEDRSRIPLVNENNIKTAPAGTINQMGHSLARIIHAFALTSRDEKVFMAKWDIEDSLWCLNCE